MPEIAKFGGGPEIERPKVMVVGCGGAGCNTLAAIPPIPNLDVMALNDAPHPSMAMVENKVLIRSEGLYDVAVSEKMSMKGPHTEVEKRIETLLKAYEVIIIIAGLGGNVGTWSSSIVASITRRLKALTIALTNLPFAVEGLQRRAIALNGLKMLQMRANVVVTFANDSLLKLAPDIPLARAFEVMSRLMVDPVIDISKVMTKSDIPHLRRLFKSCREMRVGIGEGVGPNRTFLAVEDAFRSPWLDIDIEKARTTVLLISSASSDVAELNDVVREVSRRAYGADIIWGSLEEELGEKMKVTAILGI